MKNNLNDRMDSEGLGNFEQHKDLDKPEYSEEYIEKSKENKIEKAEQIDDSHLKEMIEEHERLVSLLEKHSDKEDISKELETQKKELEQYKKQLKDGK